MLFSCDSNNQFHEVGRITVAQLTARNNHSLLKFQCIHACFKKTMILYLTVLSSYFFPSKNNLKQISKLVYTHVLFLLTKFLISWAKQNTSTWIIIYSLVLLQSKSQITGSYTSYLKLQDVQTIIVLCSMFLCDQPSVMVHFLSLLSQSRCPDREIQLWQPGSFVAWYQCLLCDRLCHVIQPFFGWLRGWSHLCGYSIRMTRNGIWLRRTRRGVLLCPCIEPVAL